MGANMSIEAAAGAASVAAAKGAGGASAAALGAGAGVATSLAMVVVMLWKKPRSEAEWVTAVITTAVSSLCGGAFVILYFGLLRWIAVTDPAELLVGLVAIGGVFFSCGLPGWALVRWVFNWIAKREGQDIGQVVQDAAKTIREVV